jgi:endonuclease/exonuclease/phosphatase family metal-dependent hydrolase
MFFPVSGDIKFRDLVLQVGGWAWGQQPNTVKKIIVQKPSNEPRNMDRNNGKINGNAKQKRLRMMDIKMATWNIRTMLQPGKMKEIADEVIKYNLDLVALQEMRWQGHGQIDKKDFSLLYSGPTERTGQYGVGFMIRPRMRACLLGFYPVNDRLCRIRVKGRFRNISIISAYAPTEEAREEDKEAFYDVLSGECSLVPKYDTLILLGDFNARIGKEHFVSSVAGRHTLHEVTNENGKRLSELAMLNNMVISSTCFPHKNIHKGTWHGSATGIVSQIDHVLIARRHASSMIDVKSLRGPNCDTDHYLVFARLRERLSVVQNSKGVKKSMWNVENLKDINYARQYEEMMERRIPEGLDEIAEEEKDVDELWENLKDTITDVARETLGEKRRERNCEWYDEECRAAIRDKNENRQLMLQRDTRSNRARYKESRKVANKLCRKKKREFMKKHIENIEAMNERNDSRKFYQAIKMMRKGFQPNLIACKDKNGKVLGEDKEILERWAEFFEGVFSNNRQEDDEEVVHFRAEPLVLPPSYNEIEDAIRKLKNNKAPGSDSIAAELIKSGGQRLFEVMHTLIKWIWEKEVMPEEWTKGIICPILKKGDKLECSNYRGITLLSTAYKVFSAVLLKRIKVYAEEILEEHQCGFREGRGTTDQIFAMRQTMEKCYEYDVDLYMFFVDFRQAFDSVSRRRMTAVLHEIGIPAKLTSLVKVTLAETTAQVKIGNRASREFRCTSGVKQGDALSATLFNIVLNAAMKDLSIRGSIVNRTKQVFAYADDIVLVSRNKQSLIEMFEMLRGEVCKYGLEINYQKTKYMKMSPSERRRTVENLITEEYQIEGVREFKYLGVTLTNDNSVREEICNRIMAGNRAYFANVKLFKSKLVSRQTKMKLYKTIVRPVISYGAETWTMSKNDENALRRLERKIIRKIWGPIWDGNGWRVRRNVEIEGFMGGEDVVRYVKARRIEWLGHVERLSEERLPKVILYGKMDGVRRRGRPRTRWLRDVTDDLKVMEVRNWRAVAWEREEWRQIVREAKVHPGL